MREFFFFRKKYNKQRNKFRFQKLTRTRKIYFM